ncbi:MAG: acyl-ACP thioesterase domain-containing protein [Acidimicrobiales bacterium]
MPEIAKPAVEFQVGAGVQSDVRFDAESVVEPLPSMLPEGRHFRGERKVRLGDVGQAGRLRFDALTRYTQDVSDDDTTDAGLPENPGWVVRSTVVDQLSAASLGERLSFTTFCSGLGKRWAERRLSIHGDRGAHYEVATIWVCVDPVTGQPHALTDEFLQLYGAAAGGRKVSARLKNPRLADQEPTGVSVADWQLRAADYDVYGHVNNAAYWALLEQWTPESVLANPLRARLEYGAGLAPADSVLTARTLSHSGLQLWWLESGEHAANGTAGRSPSELLQGGSVASVLMTPLAVSPY